MRGAAGAAAHRGSDLVMCLLQQEEKYTEAYVAKAQFQQTQ